MTEEEMEDAFGAAELLESYITLWNRTFPNHTHRSHWHIINTICSEHDGAPFSVIRARLSESLGMDDDTCVSRVYELVTEKFANISGSRISPSTFIVASEYLENKFHQHSVDAINLLYNCAKMYTKTTLMKNRIDPRENANMILKGFFDEFGDYWTSCLGAFLRNTVSSPAHRVRAMRRIRTFPYWHILVTSWKHQHRRSPFRNKYLFVEDFHGKIYEITSSSTTTTRNHVEEMIVWGFLQRLNREDGVLRNKFAVRMTPKAVEHFTPAFANIMNIITSTVKSAVDEDEKYNSGFRFSNPLGNHSLKDRRS